MNNRKRSWMITIGFIGAFFCIITRLLVIQVISTHSFSNEQIDLIEQAQDRQNSEIVLDSGRGDILDRNGRSLVGERNWHLLAFPQTGQQIQLKLEKFKRLSEATGYPLPQLTDQLTHLARPRILAKVDGDELILTPELKKLIKELQIPGIIAVESDQRISINQLAQQVIGRIARNPFLTREKYPNELKNGQLTLQSRIGISGLEEAFELYLHGEDEKMLLYTKDRTGKPLNGVQVKTKQKEDGSGFSTHTIVTTLDRDIQKIVEKSMNDEKVEDGAVVVQDIATGDLLAMGSRPNGNTISNHLNPWENRALIETIPGSIFKTVVAVAALNEGIITPNTLFHCNGELKKYHLKDAHKGGHGKETFSQAYANSCNVVLGEVAAKLGGKKLEEYAKRLGLGQQIIWSGSVFKEPNFHQISLEQSGLIFAPGTSENDTGAVVQSGIGQHDLKVTPVQAANMVTALFHKGRAISPRIVTEIRDSNGHPVFKFINKYLTGATPIKESTLKAVRQMMRQVVTDGTATSVSKAAWSLAGKTGTAQLGVDKNKYNKWMTGYGPVDHPRYVVAVLIHSVPNPDDPRAKRIFQQVMDQIAQMKQQQDKEQKTQKDKETEAKKSKDQEATERKLKKKNSPRPR